MVSICHSGVQRGLIGTSNLPGHTLLQRDPVLGSWPLFPRVSRLCWFEFIDGAFKIKIKLQISRIQL